MHANNPIPKNNSKTTKSSSIIKLELHDEGKSPEITNDKETS